MRIVLENIKELVQVEDPSVKLKAGSEMSRLRVLNNAYIVMRDGLIEGLGLMKDLDHEKLDNDVLMELDCSGRLVFPSYCDSHTHLSFPLEMERLFAERVAKENLDAGKFMHEGILSLSRIMKKCTETDLYNVMLPRLSEIASLGTGAVEIKSGYGLTVDSELKILRAIKRLKEDSPLIIKSTFLGAHAMPEMYKSERQKYIEILVHEMIPQISAEGLADFIDIACGNRFFSMLETEQILMAGIKYELRPKIHVCDPNAGDAIHACIKYNALSVDFMGNFADEEINSLKGTETMPTITPGSAFFMNMTAIPARRMIDAGLPVAFASDYNPLSFPSGNMNIVQSIGCINYQVTPEEAINAATLNSAYAMGVEGICGSLCEGKIANMFITKEIEGCASIPYNFGNNLVETVILDGKIIK